jgi:hypothetical protein
MGFLSLGRALHYQYDMFNNLLEKNEEPFEAARHAYEHDLKPFMSSSYGNLEADAMRFGIGSDGRFLRRQLREHGRPSNTKGSQANGGLLEANAVKMEQAVLRFRVKKQFEAATMVTNQ